MVYLFFITIGMTVFFVGYMIRSQRLHAREAGNDTLLLSGITLHVWLILFCLLQIWLSAGSAFQNGRNEAFWSLLTFSWILAFEIFSALRQITGHRDRLILTPEDLIIQISFVFRVKLSQISHINWNGFTDTIHIKSKYRVFSIRKNRLTEEQWIRFFRHLQNTTGLSRMTISQNLAEKLQQWGINY